MKTMTNYQSAFNSLCQISNAQKNNTNLINLQKKLKIQDLEKLSYHIENRLDLGDYKAKTDLNSNSCAILFSKGIPMLFCDAEIIDYFVDVLYAKLNDALNWKKPNKKELFREITGYTNAHAAKRNFTLALLYDSAYKTFCERFYYPESYKVKTLNLIKSYEPLIHNYHEFKRKHANGDDSYLVYLDKYIIDRVGEVKFREYLDIMVRKYMDSVSTMDITSITNDRILEFIFGYHWFFMMHVNCYTNGRRSNKPAHFRLHQLLLKSMFPYVHINYRGAKTRQAAYTFLGLTQNEIDEYEKQVVATDLQNTTYKLMIPAKHSDIALPNGHSTGDIYRCFDEYFDNVKEKFRLVPSKRESIKAVKNTVTDSILLKDYNYAFGRSKYRSIIKAYIDNLIIESKEYMYDHNKQELYSSKDRYVLYFLNNETYSSATIDLSPIANSPLKNEFRSFVRFSMQPHKCTNESASRCRGIVRALSYFMNEFNIMSSADVREWHVLSYLNYLEIEESKKPNTISVNLTFLRIFYDYLTSHYEAGSLMKNPTLNIKLSDLRDHTPPTPVIPDDILVFLDNHIDELRKKDISIIYKILMETGWRFSDVVEVKTKDIRLIPGNNDLASISVSSPKTRKSRIANRLGDVIEDVVSMDLYNEIQDYIRATEKIRDVYKIDTLFYAIVNGVSGHYGSGGFNKALQKLCKKHGINSIDESYWNVSSRQTRKTVASSLISAGLPLSAVQKKLGHVSHVTTEKIYAEVHQKTIRDLNNEFYKRKFDIYMDEEKLSLFTEEERKILYVDFCLNVRTVELGLCSKHPSEGRCASIGHMSCAQCPKLCTGKSFLDGWERLANDSKELLYEFVKVYKDKRIPKIEYEKFIEYSQEEKLFLHYQTVIDEIKKGVHNG